MTAIIATIAPGAAWISTDSFRGQGNASGGKSALVHGGSMVAAATSETAVLDAWSCWLETVAWPQAVAGTGPLLRERRAKATTFLVRPGAGFAFTFEDGFQAHGLQYRGHSCRPSFADIPGIECLHEASVRAGQSEDVEQFHLAYLRAAADWPDKPRYIGGTGWCARLTERGGEVLELGALA